MIQRIQTIFLALAAICMFSVLFFPVLNLSTGDGEREILLTAYQLQFIEGGEPVNEQPTFYIAVLVFLSATLAIASIFSYKNRLTQMKLNFGNTLFMAATLGINLYFIFEAEDFLLGAREGSFGIGFYLVPSAMIFNSLANRFIRKDEKLVRSADRFR